MGCPGPPGSWLAGTRRSALPSRGVDIAELFFGEFDRVGGDVLLNMGDFAGAGDWQHRGSALRHPGERDLTRGHPSLPSVRRRYCPCRRACPRLAGTMGSSDAFHAGTSRMSAAVRSSPSSFGLRTTASSHEPPATADQITSFVFDTSASAPPESRRSLAGHRPGNGPLAPNKRERERDDDAKPGQQHSLLAALQPLSRKAALRALIRLIPV